jgi:hypothetical protein
VAHRLLHRLLGDGVEHDAVDRLVLQAFLPLRIFVDVPGDRLALAVGVGREDQLVGVLDRARDVVEALGALASTSQSMAKSASGSTEPSLAVRSRTWPNEA